MTTRHIREMKSGDQYRVIDYFLNADIEFLDGMGVERGKLPDRETWSSLISEDLRQPLKKRQFYYLLWEFNGEPVGHSNINKIIFGQEAYMHLHLWEPELRKAGLGQWFVSECIIKYFEKFNLEVLLCEPYAQNPGPNKTLEKMGFSLVKTYDTVPGWINYHQTVNRWVLTRDTWQKRSQIK